MMHERIKVLGLLCIIILPLALLLCLPSLKGDHMEKNDTSMPPSSSRPMVASSSSSSMFRFRKNAHDATSSVAIVPLVVSKLSKAMIANKVRGSSTFSKDSTSSTLSLRRRRYLALGDFDELNEFLQDVELELPDSDVSEDLLLSNLICTDFRIDDMVVSYEQTSNQRLAIKVDVKALDMTCYMDYQYGTWPFSTSGSLDAFTLDNNVTLTLGLFTTSSSFDNSPPTNATLDMCNATINVNDIQFDGGIVAGFLNVLSGLIANVVESLFAETLCTEAGDVVTDLVADLLQTANEFVLPNTTTTTTIVDPLLPEKTLLASPPNNIALMDFSQGSSEEGPFGMAFDMLREQVDSYFNVQVEDPDTGEQDLGANVFMRSNVLDETGALVLELDMDLFDNHDNTTHTTLELEAVKLFGLDTFTKFNPLEPIGNYTLKNELAMQSLMAELDLKLTIRPSTLQDSVFEESSNNDTVDDVIETIQIEVGAKEIDAVASLLLAVKQDTLGDMPLGAILDPSALLPCLLSTVHQVELSELGVSVTGFAAPTMDGEESSKGIARVLFTLVQALFSVYEKTVQTNLPNLMATKALDYINTDVIQSYVDDPENKICIRPTQATGSGRDFIDFRDLLLTPEKSRELGGSGEKPYGDLIRLLVGFIKKEALTIDSDTGLSSLNELIRPILESFSDDATTTPGAIVVDGDLFEGSYALEVGERIADIELRAFDATIENVDSLGAPIELLEPVLDEPNILNNTVTVGIGEPVRAAVRLVFSMQDEDLKLRNEIDISLDLEAATIVLGALLRISEEAFWVFPLRDLTDMNCLLATIPAPVMDAQGFRVGGEPDAAVSDLALSVAALDFNFSCVSCTSPKLNELSDLLSSPDNKDDVTEAGQMVIDLITDLVSGDFAQNQIDRMLHKAAIQCPHNEAYDPSVSSIEYEPLERPDTGSQSVTFLVAVVAAMAFVFVVALIVYFVIRRIVRKRHRKWLMSLASENIVALYKEQSRESDINKETQSLFKSPVVPRYVRYLMPVIFLGTIALFLSGHLSLAARVAVEVNLFGESYDIDKVQEFSMGKSFADIWNAGGHELAILILIFSGVWPYSKQIITIILWFMPPSKVSVSRRGSVFYWLDTLAKWSMVDVFMMVVSIASFRVSVENPDADILPDGFYTFELMVVPMWGLYANMIAQLLSQVSSHFVIHYHNRVVAEASDKYDYEHTSPKTVVSHDVENSPSNSDTSSSQSQPRTTKTEDVAEESLDRLYLHSFIRPHRGASATLVIRRGINAGLIMISIAIVILVVFGCIRPTFSVEVLGLFGLGVEFGEKTQKAVSKYGVFDLVNVLMDQARYLDSAGDYLGLGVLSVLLVFSVLVVPLSQTMLLLLHWFVPMTRQRRAKLYVVVQILKAWQYMEVYVLSILAGVWQLGRVSEYLFAPYCYDLGPTFANLLYYGVLKSRRDARCFATELSVENGIFILISAAVLLALINTFVTKAIEQYHRDTDENLLRFEAEDPNVLPSIGSFDPDSDVSEMMDKIHPIPVMFTDLFRWLLRREDSLRAEGDDDQQAKDGAAPAVMTACPTGSETASDDPVSSNYSSKVDVDDGVHGLHAMAAGGVPAVMSDPGPHKSDVDDDPHFAQSIHLSYSHPR